MSQLPDLNVPSPYSAELIAALSDVLQFTDFPENQDFPLLIEEKAVCYLVKYGCISIHRSDDGLLFTTLQAPLLLGCAGQSPIPEKLYIRTLETSSIASLTQDELYRFIEQKGLWALFSKHLRFMVNKLYLFSTYPIATSAYDIVRLQLMELMKETEYYRLNTSAIKYIQDKTRLSRSSIMKILAQLKAGEYIVVQNGILLEVKSLPEKY